MCSRWRWWHWTIFIMLHLQRAAMFIYEFYFHPRRMECHSSHFTSHMSFWIRKRKTFRKLYLQIMYNETLDWSIRHLWCIRGLLCKVSSFSTSTMHRHNCALGIMKTYEQLNMHIAQQREQLAGIICTYCTYEARAHTVIIFIFYYIIKHYATRLCMRLSAIHFIRSCVR